VSNEFLGREEAMVEGEEAMVEGEEAMVEGGERELSSLGAKVRLKKLV
jgi:hypothetical protein